MHYLLDTHILLWFLSANKFLDPGKKDIINNLDCTISVSISSLWEISIKLKIEKIKLDCAFSELPVMLNNLNIGIQGILFSHIEITKDLPLHHRDPFDRMIISQAIAENLTIITEDQHFKQYPVKVL